MRINLVFKIDFKEDYHNFITVYYIIYIYYTLLFYTFINKSFIRSNVKENGETSLIIYLILKLFILV